MTVNDICIVIPVYKSRLNQKEEQSVRQCFTILNDYKIYFIGPKGMDLSYYEQTFHKPCNFIAFDLKYFESISGYNKLLLSGLFYQSFKHFQFMLVYQTDCFVFKDELLFWAKKRYDYLGGVWFENYNDNPYQGAKLWQAGNGGLSLRNIQKCYRLVSSRRPVNKWRDLVRESKFLKNVSRLQYLYCVLQLPFYRLGFKNNLRFKAKQFTGNEDTFFITEGLKLRWFRIPDVLEASLFSWDKFPNYLWDSFNELPFGCHAWYREDAPYEINRSFWKNIIQEDIQ